MSTAANGGDPTLIPSLPNDVAVNILARLPRAHHPSLSLVSRPIRAFLSSPLLYRTRSLVGSAQPTLYFSLRVPSASPPSLRWFCLSQTPPAPLLCPLPPPPFSLVGSAFAAVGPMIYVIGGSAKDVPSQRVWCLDCRARVWEAAPSMRVAREFAAAGVVDRRVYVIGGCVVDTWTRSRNWAEVFDPESRRWDPVESSGDIVRAKWMHASAVVGGRIYAMADRNGVVYEPQTGRWGSVGGELDLGWRGRACVVGGVLYCYDYLGKIRGFDVGKEGAVWKELRGVEKELPRFLCGATMADLGGNLVVVWEVKGNGREEPTEVWGAEIEVELKRGEEEEEEEEELWGRVLWCAVIHRAPIGSGIVHCLAVTL